MLYRQKIIADPKNSIIDYKALENIGYIKEYWLVS